jgi:hypothetical protein
MALQLIPRLSLLWWSGRDLLASQKNQSFLGLSGYYRHFVPNFSSITNPLTKLLEKCVPFVWTNDCEVSYQALKDE